MKPATFMIWATTAVALGCGSSEPTSRADGTPVTVNADWVPVAAADDPFQDRPETVSCPASGYGLEDGFFEIETDACGYGTFMQLSQVAIAQGQAIRVNLWHSPLSSEEPAEAHLAIQLGDWLMFERRIPIPNPAQVLDEYIVAGRDIEAGTPVYLHVHNHGNNFFTDWDSSKFKEAGFRSRN